jgi:GT2 family glycosyltransferase
LFDEKFFLYVEDLEFSRRVSAQFRMFYTPQGKVYHKSGAGTGWASYTPTYLYYHTRNRLWASQADARLYRFYVLLFTLLNATAKSLMLLLNVECNAPSRIQSKIIALWRGVKDGLRQPPQLAQTPLIVHEAELRLNHKNEP